MFVFGVGWWNVDKNCHQGNISHQQKNKHKKTSINAKYEATTKH
jgi:hypothetical protein